MRHVNSHVNFTPIVRFFFNVARDSFSALEGHPTYAYALVAVIAVVGSGFTMFRANHR